MTLGVVFLILVLGWLACTRMNPINATQSLQENLILLVGMLATPNQIIVNGGQSEIRVQLVDENNNPMTNQEIIFSTSLGDVTAAVKTDGDGWASAVLTSGQTAGSAVVSAYYREINPVSVTVTIISTSQSLMQIAAEPDILLANGLDVSTVRVTVVDDSAKPVAGASVEFQALGLTSSIMTDAEGISEYGVISIASSTDTTIIIQATYGSISVAVSILLKGIELSVGANPMAIQADGESNSSITVVIKETMSHVAIPNAKVRFGTDLGTITSEALTNSQGIAQATLKSEATVGTAHVIVYYGNVFTDTVEVDFSSEPQTTYTLSTLTFDKGSILANGVDASSINAKIIDNHFNPVQGAVVDFSRTAGVIAAQGVTNDQGVATVQLTARASQDDSTAVVTAQLSNQSLDVTIVFLGVQMEISALPTSIIADEQSTSRIMVILKRSTSKISIANDVVSFSTDLGTIPGQAITNSSGIAQVDLSSGTTTGTAQVIARYGNLLTAVVNVQFQPSVPTFLEVMAAPPVIPADGTTQSMIGATVSDATRNPVPDGIPVYFNIIQGTGGTILNQRATSGGTATSPLSSTAPGTIRVRVSVGALADTVSVVCTVESANQVLVSADRDSMPADGIATATIEARVLDGQGNPVPNVTVLFSATIGDISQMAPTNAQGVAPATFSSSVVGTATITARVGNTVGSKIIRLLPGGTNSIVLRFDPTAIGVKATGQVQTAMVEAEVRDSRNNPVVDGTLVRFAILAGPGGGVPEGEATLSSYGTIPTVNGIARVALSSGIVSGNVRVQAEVIDDQGQSVIAIASEILIHAGEGYMENINDFTTTHLTIVANRLNIWAGMDTTQISLLVGDKYNNPVQQGTGVYFTASGGVINTHTSYTNDYGKASVILTGGNPQPTVDRFFNYFGMQDPNLGTVISGFAYYSYLDEPGLPNFEAYPVGYLNPVYPAAFAGSPDPVPPELAGMVGRVPNSEQENVVGTEYENLENDGIVRVIGYTEGQDATGDSVRAWDWLAVVFSGPMVHQYINNDFLPDQLNPGESGQIIIELWDRNGNPIESEATITAELIPSEIQARLSWTQINTGLGYGTCYYLLTVANAIDPEDPKPGWTSVLFKYTAAHQFGTIGVSRSVYISE